MENSTGGLKVAFSSAESAVTEVEDDEKVEGER
jgi:hypothetical protein